MPLTSLQTIGKKNKVYLLLYSFALQISQPLTVQFSPSTSPKCPDRLWGPPSLLFNGYRDSLPGVVQPGREADHSRSPSAEVKNEWNYTSSTFIALTRTGSSSTFLPLRTGYKPPQSVVERPEPTFLPRIRETKFHLTINSTQYRVFVGKPGGKRPWGDPGVDGRIILRWIFREWEVGIWTGSSWLRIGTGGARL